jgi:hypothetical protein
MRTAQVLAAQLSSHRLTLLLDRGKLPRCSLDLVRLSDQPIPNAVDNGLLRLKLRVRIAAGRRRETGSDPETRLSSSCREAMQFVDGLFGSDTHFAHKTTSRDVSARYS